MLCSYKTNTFNLNKISVDTNLIKVFAKVVDKEHVLLFVATTSRIESSDAIDVASFLITS